MASKTDTEAPVCAIHCAATPLILLLLPVFGRFWAHPASHWLMALLVVPLAAVTVFTGYKVHRRKWVLATAVLGILLVLFGAAAPSFERGSEAGVAEISSSLGPETDSDRAAQDGTGSEWEQHRSSSYLSGSYLRMPSSPSLSVSHISGGGCVNSCCPLIETGADGAWRIHIPLASVLTALGGLFLVAAHLGNLSRSHLEQSNLATP
ncbi:MerC domain-containing protein [Verrucomicrobiales bacterium]|nr:MerC domain-containing protein [Verrucomicrobiales bacterium]